MMLIIMREKQLTTIGASRKNGLGGGIQKSLMKRKKQEERNLHMMT